MDLTISTRKYSIHADEYLQLDFFNLDSNRRKKIISRKERNEYIRVFNKKNHIPMLENKIHFLFNFKEYVNRDFLILKEANYDDYVSFLSKHKGYVAKESDSGQGRGVEIVAQVNDSEKEFKRLKEKSYDLIEEIIETHPILKDISPGGIPPIRIITFVDENNKPHLIFSAINISVSNKVVNFNSGAIKAIINPENGEIVTDGLQKSNEVHTHHPVSRTQIKGFVVPEWTALKSMVLNAALKFPEVGYIGWDCTITKNGPSIIEANAKSPAINGLQMEGYKKADETYANFELVRDALRRRKAEA